MIDVHLPQTHIIIIIIIIIIPCSALRYPMKSFQEIATPCGTILSKDFALSLVEYGIDLFFAGVAFGLLP